MGGDNYNDDDEEEELDDVENDAMHATASKVILNFHLYSFCFVLTTKYFRAM